MDEWIETAKKTLKQIIDNVKASNKGLKVRVSFVGYRDFEDKKRFEIHPFTEDLGKVKAFISKIDAEGGDDTCEDVQGGLYNCLNLNWTPGSTRQVFLICDAPCHGLQYHKKTVDDDYPLGSKDGHQLEDLMRSFHRENIEFTIVKLDSDCDAMIRVMTRCHPGVTVTDLEHATKTKSRDEVDKMFVHTASFILRAQVGRGKSSTTTLWDSAQLHVKDIFSCISYLKVTDLAADRVTVKNHLGGSWFISRDLIEREMWSADHFSQEVKCTMTDLSEILGKCKDTVFTVQFKK